METRKNLPKVSIITPSFNQADFIERTVESVLSQNYPNFEYIIMDGGSTDGTVEILKKYGEKIIWRSKRDKGQGDAINKSLKLAKGEIFAYLNSDDVLAPGALKVVADFFIKNPKKMWVFGKCRIIDDSDKEIRSWITAYKNFWLKRYDYRTLLILNYLSQPAVFWRREASEKIGLFNNHYYWTLDYDYWLRLGKKYSPGFINRYLANFRVHQSSKTSIGVKNFLEEVEVAKQHTQNPLVIGLHYLNFLSIAIGYSLLS